jgi:hypothetical protein
MEMKIVLRSALAAYRVRPAAGGLEFTRRRSITLSPGRGGRTLLEERLPAPETTGEPQQAITAVA